MTISQISYSESREGCDAWGLKSWVRVGMEATISPEENTDAAMNELKDKVRDCFLPSGANETLPIESMKIERTTESPEVGMLNAINSCTDIKVLETFKLLVRNNPQFQEAYDNKLKQFKNK